MRNFKEGILAFTLALATLLTYYGFRHRLKAQERNPHVEEPTASHGESADPRLSLNWGIEEVHARAAWMRHRGSKDVIVAVIDTGCDVHHPDLSASIWRNPGEDGLDKNGVPKSENGIDDDGNGFVDDLHGWDFVSSTADVADGHGHGTHIAGIVGGTSGVAPGVSLMILKYYDTESSGLENLRNTIAAVKYAVKMGADVINYSGGGVMRSREEEDVLRWAASQGVLIVAAAGNEGMNSDFYHFYPADYGLPNILSVGAIDRDGQLLKMSNYGVGTVDVMAPGRNIYSTLPNGQHGYMTGTSQATAFASGLAALLIANDPRMRNPALLIEHIVNHVSERTKLKYVSRSGGVINAQDALEASDIEVAAVGRRRAPAQAN